MIDEKKLIDDIEEYFKTEIDNLNYERRKGMLDDLVDVLLSMNKGICGIIKAQPKVGEWIPCSERLPEGYTVCLITQKIGPRQYVRKVASYYCNHWRDYGKVLEDACVLAWIPLPELYREDGDSDAAD